MMTATGAAVAVGAVAVDVTRYQFAWGRRPTGQGQRAFERNGQPFWQGTGSYMECRRAARKAAAAAGVRHISVCS